MHASEQCTITAPQQFSDIFHINIGKPEPYPPSSLG